MKHERIAIKFYFPQEKLYNIEKSIKFQRKLLKSLRNHGLVNNNIIFSIDSLVLK